MEKVYVTIDRHHMKQKYFENVVGKIIARVSGCESAIAGPLATQLGITYDTQKEYLQTKKPTFIRAYMESLIDTVDNSAERWMIEHNEMFRIDEDKQHLAQEAAEADLFAEDNGDGLGDTLSDMVNELLEKKVGEIKDVAKLVLQLEKEKQKGDKEAALDENEEIEEEDAEDTTGAFDEENGENSEGESEEGGNPFGEDSTDGDFAEDSGEGSEDSGNPFGEDTGATDGDSGDSGSDNPFGSSDDGSTGETEESDGGNPFEAGSEGGSGDEGSDEGSAEGSGNPFESVQEVSKITIGGRTPFYSLRNGDLTGFVTGYTRKIFEAPMREVFDQFGQESTQFKDLSNKMKNTNKAALEALVAVVSVGQALNFKIDMDKIRDWDLYLQDIK